jgi:signal transduction histidine kinase
MKVLISIVLLLLSLYSSAQQVYLLSDPGKKSVLLSEGWVYSMGDHANAQLPDFDDRSWKPIRPTADIHDSLPSDAAAGVGWMRLRFKVNHEARNQLLAFIIKQSLASEIYLNGKMMERYGTISRIPSEVKAHDPFWKPVPIMLSPDSIQILAVRFATQPDVLYTTMFNTANPILSVEIMNYDLALKIFNNVNNTSYNFFILGMYLMLFILHISFYLMYPSKRANLYLSVYALLGFVGGVLQTSYLYPVRGPMILINPGESFYYANACFFFWMVSFLMSYITICEFLERKRDKYIWVMVLLLVAGVILNAGIYDLGWKLGGPNYQLISLVAITLISLSAVKQKKPGARILLACAAISCLAFFLFILIQMTGSVQIHLLRIESRLLAGIFFTIYTLGLPAATSFLLALDFASTSTKLTQKLVEVENLSVKNLANEKEKQEMLASQNILLEKKVNERTMALTQSLQELKSTQAQLIQSEKMASLGELTAGIAHEIQNPLNFVNNFSDVNKELADELEQEIDKGNYTDAKAIAKDIKDNEEKINHHGKRADAIVKGMLQHSRNTTHTKEPTDLNVLADEYLRLAYHGLRAKDKSFNANLQTAFDPGIGKVNVIPQDIGRVMLNLITNAFYAVNEKKKLMGDNYEPTVSVTTKKNGNSVEIVVADNGNGIPQKVVDKIFQPFFTTKPTGQGTGLGLSLAFDIVKAHGGEIKTNSTVEKGAEFTIILPLNS